MEANINSHRSVEDVEPCFALEECQGAAFQHLGKCLALLAPVQHLSQFRDFFLEALVLVIKLISHSVPFSILEYRVTVASHRFRPAPCPDNRFVEATFRVIAFHKIFRSLRTILVGDEFHGLHLPSPSKFLFAAEQAQECRCAYLAVGQFGNLLGAQQLHQALEKPRGGNLCSLRYRRFALCISA